MMTKEEEQELFNRLIAFNLHKVSERMLVYGETFDTAFEHVLKDIKDEQISKKVSS